MTVLKSLLLLQGVVLMVGCAHAHMPQGSGHAPFDELAKVAAEKNRMADQKGYAWVTAAIEQKYAKETEAGKAFAETGRKLTMVDVSLYEGEEAIKKGDIDAAMKKVKHANELADAQLSQQETSAKYQRLWR